MRVPDHLRHLTTLVEEGGRLAIAASRNAKAELKPDGSLVTDVDRTVEEFLRKELAPMIPGAAVWGEELGHGVENDEGIWLLDPIDGTSNFVYGSPLWGVSVAYVKNGRCLWGAVSLPVLGETYVADVAVGAFFNGEVMAPLPSGLIQRHELVSYPDRVEKALVGVELPGKMRHQGAVVVDAAFVCKQRFRGLIGIGEHLYDVAAILAIGEALDADIRYLDGSPLEILPLMGNQRISKPWVLFPKGTGFFIA